MDAKERIIEQLKRSGCRVTKQRLMLIDVILEGKCNCCKEIYYQASLKDPSIGPATVYRIDHTVYRCHTDTRITLNGLIINLFTAGTFMIEHDIQYQLSLLCHAKTTFSQ